MNFRQKLLGAATKEKFVERTVEEEKIFLKKPSFTFITDISMKMGASDENSTKKQSEGLGNAIVDYIIENVYQEDETGNKIKVFSEGDKEILTENITPLHSIAMTYLVDQIKNLSQDKVNEEKKSLTETQTDITLI